MVNVCAGVVPAPGFVTVTATAPDAVRLLAGIVTDMDVPFDVSGDSCRPPKLMIDVALKLFPLNDSVSEPLPALACVGAMLRSTGGMFCGVSEPAPGSTIAFPPPGGSLVTLTLKSSGCTASDAVASAILDDDCCT